MSVIAFSRAIGPVPLSCFVSERHSSSLDITEIPIETGANITDHAVVKPKTVMLDVGGQNAAATFAALVRFQESRVPFVLVTGLKVYQNMLVKRIDADRTADFSTVLKARVELQEIILVGTAYAADPNGEPTGASERGRPGGAGSTRAAPPTPERSGDAATAGRSTGTVQMGDNPTSTYPDQSILKGLLE
ncbi:phage baseplate protein [Gellertiella hungarica]|uniref:Dit-like phage tail protein N-terminal domain-containing protein n=1 Tax=Gellertiella hungarica TaxID=1572859 RepID=A0A7W6J2Q4_9HYPH|nr:hypothetical protein [Gellertiella hungarica]MBB4063691.1 hypothetical protein [Gellertiella hungarica]